ncbi:SDR family NAD(P)-dependent oxidoreductase [Nocardioides sp. STR2]|uniref:SDR family NAD(P)-dependent oxidoreductase n=1 Tax=Nocardioides pini TaxID=2975053 RepID=A0ABT4CHC5_9ACTN|nr:SDR family NAD(P)-dependent oxidoreductase [Nocardioides pini]MCY4728380.1 SDR family NAD(P)-dependent oxidoreductase [Nocardioides pini]
MDVTEDRPLALVTGAARGIGAEVARQLAEGGHAVLVTARDAAAAVAHADALVAEGHAAAGVALDVADPASVAALARELGGRPLRVLVNNAAAFADWTETATSADLEAARAVLDTNLLGPWRTVQALLPNLRAGAPARVVNVGSGSGSHGDPEFGLPTNPVSTTYAVSKAALHALTVKPAVELRDQGIVVNAADPGLTATAPGMADMGARPVPEGAASVLAALHAPAGTFTRDGETLPW